MCNKNKIETVNLITNTVVINELWAFLLLFYFKKILRGSVIKCVRKRYIIQHHPSLKMRIACFQFAFNFSKRFKNVIVLKPINA